MCLCRAIHNIFPRQTQTTSYVQNQQINLISTPGKLITQSTSRITYKIFAAIMLHEILGSLPTNAFLCWLHCSILPLPTHPK